MDIAKNFAKATVSTTYDAAATSVVLTTGHGAKLPTVPFNATWWNSTDYPDPSDDPNVEIVRVTAISTDTLTVVRGQEGISATTKNTAAKTYKILAGLTAKGVNFTPTRQGVRIHDDFMNGTVTSGDLGWSVANGGSGGAGAAASDGTGDANHPGVAQQESGTIAAGYAIMRLGTGAILLGGGELTFEWIVKLDTVPDGTEDYTVRYGLLDASSTSLAAAVDGVYFEIDRAVSTTNWLCRNRSNSTQTSTTTSTAFTNGWVRLKAVINAAGTSIEYFIDGASVATHTTNIPTGAGRHCSPMGRIDKVAGTTERIVYVDAFDLEQIFTTAR